MESVKQLRLNNMANVKKSLARLARELHGDPNADIGRYRTIAYILNVWVSAHKADMETLLYDLEKRVEEHGQKTD